MKRLVALLIVGGLSPGSLRAADETKPATHDVLTLVAQLGSNDFREREQASARLEQIGPSALDALRSVVFSEDQEVRERAIVIIDKIQRAAVSASRLKPRKVALAYVNLPLGTAVNELRAQTGLDIAINPARVANPLRTVTVRTGEAPVWEAVEAFCTAAGLREVHHAELPVPKQPGPRRNYYVPPPPPPNAESVRIELEDGRAERLPGDRSTSVRVVALPPTFSGHKVTLGSGDISFCLDVAPAPGIGWQDVTGVRITRLIDDSGRSGGAGLDRTPQPPPFDASGVVMFAGRPGVAWRIDTVANAMAPENQPNPRVIAVPLRVNTLAARSLKRLEGVVYAECHTPEQTLITVNDPKQWLNRIHAGSGDVRLTVLEVTETKKGGILRVQLEYPSPWMAAQRRRGAWNFGLPEAPQAPGETMRVDAFDAAGNKVNGPSDATFDTSDDGFTNVQIIRFQTTNVPARLVVTGPKPTVVQIPFALTDVPLP